MTPNDFLKIIQQEMNRVEEIPNGWYNTHELAKLWNLSLGNARKKISFGKKQGYVTEAKFCYGNKRKMKIPYYFFHEKENSQKNNKRTKMENTIRLRGKN